MIIVQVRKLVTLFRQEAKYWQKEREKQQYKIMSSGLQPGLRPGYPTRNEVCYFLDQLVRKETNVLHSCR